MSIQNPNHFELGISAMLTHRYSDAVFHFEKNHCQLYVGLSKSFELLKTFLIELTKNRDIDLEKYKNISVDLLKYQAKNIFLELFLKVLDALENRSIQTLGLKSDFEEETADIDIRLVPLVLNRLIFLRIAFELLNYINSTEMCSRILSKDALYGVNANDSYDLYSVMAEKCLNGAILNIKQLETSIENEESCFACIFKIFTFFAYSRFYKSAAQVNIEKKFFAIAEKSVTAAYALSFVCFQMEISNFKNQSSNFSVLEDLLQTLFPKVDFRILPVFTCDNRDGSEHEDHNVEINQFPLTSPESWETHIEIADQRDFFSIGKTKIIHEGYKVTEFAEIDILDLRGTIMIRNAIFGETQQYTSSSVYKKKIFGAFVNVIDGEGLATFYSNKHICAVANSKQKFVLENNALSGEKSIVLHDTFPTLWNFSHWILDGLPRVVEAYHKYKKTIPITFLGPILDFHQETLLACNVDMHHIKCYHTKNQRPIKIRNAVVVSPTWFVQGQNPKIVCSAVLNIRDRLFKNYLSLQKKPPKKLHYIPHLNRIINENSELNSIFNDFGVELVETARRNEASGMLEPTLNLGEMIKIFSETKVLISNMGSGLVNMIFMQPNSVVLAFSNSPGDLYFQLAEILKIRLICLKGEFEAVSGSPTTKNPSFQLLRKTLREVY